MICMGNMGGVMIGKRVVGLALGVIVLSSSAPALAEDHGCTVAKMLELPVTVIDRQPTVPVMINGQSTRLVADSGAFFSTVPEATAKQFGLRIGPAPAGFYMETINGRASIEIGTADQFQIGGLKLHHIQFVVGGSAPGQAGLLGQNVLGVADVEYDLADGVIRLMKPDHCSHDTALAYWAGGKAFSVLTLDPLDNANRQTTGTVFLNGKRLRAVFDTGAGTTLLTKDAAERVGFRPDGPGVEEDGYSTGLGRDLVKTWTAPFESLTLGDNETIRNIRLRVGDIHDDSYDMLVGADFFLSHRVYVSNKLRRMFFSYNGGPVFDLTRHHEAAAPGAAAAADGDAAPTTAEGYAGRGNAEAARHEYARARADLDHAVTLAPNDGRYRYQRAQVELAMEDRAAAIADLDAAAKSAPDDADIRLLRAGLRLDKDKTGAAADVAAADRALAPQDDRRLQLAGLYDWLGDATRAIAVYGQWIDAHPNDAGLPNALNNRCWLRALNDFEISDAIHDCSRAVRMRPHTAGYLDSRGLAYLRAGKFDKALADYDDALRLQPKLASSLYGRGIARRHLGDAAAGDRDIAAARASDNETVDTLAGHGIRP
jgi:tetratricopeptide (TPR) repeat protein